MQRERHPLVRMLKQHPTRNKLVIIKNMTTKTSEKLKDGDQCNVIAGTHTGKTGTVRDVNTSKTGHITITVEQVNGMRFKTLGKNVIVQ
jgi:ribosomal protein S4E